MKSFLSILFVVLLVALVAAALAVWRRWGIAQWKRAALSLNAAYLGTSPFRAGIIEGSYGDRPVRVTTGVSYEDGPAYHHTAAAMACPNPGSLVLGVRRKSVLEQFTSRNETVVTPTGDDDFDSLFFVVCNDQTVVDCVLSIQVRQQFKPLDEVELYVRDESVIVRRPGERRLSRELVEMVALAGAVADIVSTLPPRRRSMIEQMEDEDLLKEGI